MKLVLMPLQNDNLVRVRCEGAVSLRGLPAVPDPLETLLGPGCYALRVLLGLDRCDGIDTSGVHWLLSLVPRFAQAQGKLILFAVPPVVEQVLLFMRATTLLPIAPGEAAARELALAVPDVGGALRHRRADERPLDVPRLGKRLARDPLLEE